MGDTPLAEAYERLKTLRRRGRLSAQVFQSVRELVERQGTLFDELDEMPLYPVDIVRIVEIKTLADRIFGDEGKAADWLKRPNRELSDQRPLDLLQDEIGTAVVREILERIDHGIFA